MEKLSLNYLTVNSAKSFAFYMIPKELIDNELFDSIDINSKVLYSLMLNRSSLSATNPDFIDENGNVYIIYTVEQVKADLRCSNQTAMKMIKQLEGSGLIQRQIRGQGKAAITYVMDFSTAKLSTVEYKDSKKQNSEKQNPNILKSRKQGFQKVERSHTNQKNHTNHSDTDLSIQAEPVDNSDKAPKPPLDDVRFSDENSSHNLNIQNLISKYPDKSNTLTEIDNLISNVYSSREQTFRVGGKNVPTYEVRYALRSIDNRHIEYILNSLKNTDNVKDFKAYLLTSLVNSTKMSFIDANSVRNRVENNINLDSLLSKYPKERKDLLEINEIIIETLIAKKKSFRIAMGELPSEFVKQSFAALTDEHVEYVLKSLRENITPVKSVKAYIQTCLFNSTKTINNHISLDTQRWLYEHLGIEPQLR